MTFASALQARRLGFDYSTREMQRFTAIAKNVPPMAQAFWFIIFIVCYFALFTPIIIFSVSYFTSTLLSLASIIAGVFVTYPAAAAISGYVTDSLFRLPPLAYEDDDSELYNKIKWQLIFVAILAVIAGSVITILEL
jgi:hypothetical protein